MRHSVSMNLFAIMGLFFCFHSQIVAEEMTKGNKLTASLEFRPRLEFVDDGELDADGDGSDDTKNASAFTTRSTMNIKVDELFGIEQLKANFQGIHVSSLLREYNSTSVTGNNDPDYAVVIDPPNTRISQAYLEYQHGMASYSLGRKLLALADHRFVGTVGWRQMPQSFGVAEVKLAPTTDFNLQLDYVYERLGIKDEFNTRYDVGSLFVYGTYNLSGGHSLSAFDIAIQNLHDTYGIKYQGSLQPGSEGFIKKISYDLTYAVQMGPSFKESDVTVASRDSYFYDANLLIVMGLFSTSLNYHVLGEAQGDTMYGFSTPFATLHKFEGWSDVMLGKVANGDPNGLSDFNLGINGTIQGLGSYGVKYHKYGSVKDSLDYGSEIEVLFKYPICELTTLLYKAAIYSKGEDFASEDVTKHWFMTNFSI